MNFTESQHFRQWWLVILLIFPVVFPVIIMFANDGGLDSEEKSSLIVVLCADSLVFWLMWFTHLKTSIDKEGVSFTFFPYINRKKLYRWEETERAYLRKYNPLGEYGGWGLKGGFKSGKAYNVSGNMGLQLVLRNGKKVLIGTRKAKEMDAFLQQLKQEYSVTAIQPAEGLKH